MEKHLIQKRIRLHNVPKKTVLTLARDKHREVVYSEPNVLLGSGTGLKDPLFIISV